MRRPLTSLLLCGAVLVAMAGTGAPAAATNSAGLTTSLTNPWQPLGKGPLRADDPTYGNTFGDGFVNLEGRVSDYAWDPAHNRLFASVASGGAWVSADRGKTWTSIGETLPTQTVGSIAYSTAGGGTIIALTGDNAFGGTTFAGLGAYWSVDGGAHWTRSLGLPSGAQGFRVAVSPDHPSTIFAATGFGLYRSVDTGVNFVNVDLPTGPCHGDSTKPGCFLANIVTDVAVQGTDTLGHAGGAVLAAVGWRAGNRKSFGNTVESPANGLYYSADGTPGSFAFENSSDNIGFAKQVDIGRVALGPAIGADQDHRYIYAAVQDATLFRKGTVEGLDVPANTDPLGVGVCPSCTPTYFNGVYVSADFGKTWTLVASRNDFQDPANGSTLATLQPLGFGPGIQSWYDLWIKPDPTRTSGGVPTRLDLGLEEIYENRDTLLPQNKQTTFRAVGPYNANTGACILVALASTCGTKQGVVGATTTHPDQHGAIWLPGPGVGDVTLVVGNDGGNYTQPLPAGVETSQAGFGPGDQAGFNTLLPYGVDIANDGTIYAGLQDNGELRIDHETGKQNMVYGGDGIFTVVDPADSKTVFEETPDGGISISKDGGVTWTSANALAPNPSFYSPLVMDPTNSKHLVTGGRLVEETVDGSATPSGNTDASAATSTSTGWINVFDLGTRKHPGVPPATDNVSGNPIIEPGDVQNQIQAMGVSGAAMYAGFCGDCDPIRDNLPFHGGLATNVGGAKPPATRSTDGWHFAAANGLPQRIITSVTIDPRNHSTVYVTLGTSSERPWAPPGAQAGDGLDAGTGQVFKSTDAGQNFTDISGNLPPGGGQWTLLRGDQLLVATVSGVYASVDPAAASAHAQAAHVVSQPSYVRLGQGLPAAPVYSMTLKHNDPNTLVVASLGRGIYMYQFAAFDSGPGTVPAAPAIAGGGGTPNTSRGLADPATIPLALILVVGVVALLGVRRLRVRRR